MPDTRLDLDRYREDRALISFRRERIDDYRIQGFVLAHSPELVLFRKINDFVDDGHLIIPRADISSVTRDKTDQYQLQMLIEDGVVGGIDFSYRPPLESLSAFLQSLPPEQLLIVEDEYGEGEDGFLLGRLTAVDARTVSVHYVSGAGNWNKQATTWELARVSCVQIDSTYLSAYARKFARTE